MICLVLTNQFVKFAIFLMMVFVSVGLLTVTDFIRILCHYYRNSQV